MQKIGEQFKIVIYLPDEILETVDQKRGLVPRSTYIKNILSKELKKPITANTV